MVMSGSMLLLSPKSGSMILLWLGSVLMTVACVASKGHVDVCGLCCSLKPHSCLWALLLRVILT